LKVAHGLLEVDYLPSAQGQIQDAESGHRSAQVAAHHKVYEPGPVKPVGGDNQEVILVPGSVPGKIDKQDAYFKADEYKE
jgi:hypothetical protein